MIKDQINEAYLDLIKTIVDAYERDELDISYDEPSETSLKIKELLDKIIK